MVDTGRAQAIRIGFATPRVKEILGADGSCEGEDDLVLGAFYLGVCNMKKMNAYRSGRKSMSEKVKWVY